MGADMGECSLNPIDDGDGEDGVQPFGIEVARGRRVHARHDGAGARVGAEAAAGGGEVGGEQGQQGRRDGGVDQQGFGGAADAGAAQLGVGEHGAGHRRVGGGVDIGVAQPLGMGEHGDAGFGLHPFDQGFAAARDDEVDLAGGGEHGGDIGAVGRGRDLHGGIRQAGGAQAGGDGGVDGAGGVETIGPAAQDDGVAGFQAEAGGVCPDIGAAFIDHADHADRGGDALEVQAVRLGPVRQHAGERVGQGGDIVQALGHGFDPCRGEGEAVAEGGGAAIAVEGGEVLRVGGDDAGAGGAQLLGGGVQAGVAGGGRHLRQDRRGVAGGGGGVAHPVADDVRRRIHCLRFLSPGRGRHDAPARRVRASPGSPRSRWICAR